MYHAINIIGHGKNVVNGLNANDTLYLKEQMEPIGKLSSNNASQSGMLPSASKYILIKFSDKCIHILINKDRLNGLKGSTKM